jgi:glutathione S-transferase
MSIAYPTSDGMATDAIYKGRAIVTVEAYLQAANCPQHIRNAWLYLRKGLEEVNTAKGTMPNSALEEILTRLASIEKRLSASPLTSQKQLTYADSARAPAPAPSQERLVPGRALKEVTVQVLSDPKPSQTIERLVESINAAQSNMSGKVPAARKLQSGYILVTADSQETKNLIDQEEGWTKVIAGKTKVKGQRFTVMAHSVRTNRIETENQEKAIAELQAQNPQLKNKVKFIKVTWMKKTLKKGRLHGQLLIDVGTPEEADTLVHEGLLHNHELKNCELFHSECKMT